MQIIFQMRYSYFGFSGWQSDASKDPGLLFEPGRLAQRAYLAQHIALQSLKDQTDPDFKLVVLSSEAMPEAEQTKLVEMCHAMLGPERVDVIFRPYGRLNKWLRRYMQSSVTADHAVQVVLDDDDALSRDFVATLRREAEFARATFETPDDYCFLSFPRGISAVFADEGITLLQRYNPFTNLGLSLLGPRGQALTPFATAHKKIALRHPSRVISTMRPTHIRSVHGLNDSKAQTSEVLLTEDDMPATLEAFPLLRPLLEQYALPVG